MDSIELQWQRLTHRTNARLRLGAIVQSSLPVAVVFGFVLLAMSIAGRLYEWEWTATVVIASVVVIILVGLLLMKLRGKRESEIAGFARLDCTLGLHNALSAAAAGRGKWPALPANCDDLLRFRWGRILPPYLGCILLAVAGLLIPLPADALGSAKIPAPQSHEDLAALIVDLEKVEALKKEDLRQLQQQLDEITSQPAENWYSHSSLEAADHLQNGIQEQLRAMESGLSMAASSLESLEKAGDSMSSAEQQRLAGQFKASLEGLKHASPGLNRKLMESLSSIDPGKLKALPAGELRKMIEQMRTAAGACKNCQGQSRGGRKGGDGDAQSELDGLLEPGDGRQGDQEGPGRGGIQRGPGVAALPLSSSPTELATDKPESLQADDLSRTRPGDAIGTAGTEHKLDKTSASPRPGGAAASGQGGEAVSRDALLPSEKAVLKSYFR